MTLQVGTLAELRKISKPWGMQAKSTGAQVISSSILPVGGKGSPEIDA